MLFRNIFPFEIIFGGGGIFRLSLDSEVGFQWAYSPLGKDWVVMSNRVRLLNAAQPTANQLALLGKRPCTVLTIKLRSSSIFIASLSEPADVHPRFSLIKR